ncbi:winged helix-turn-helix domain-containing protein [Paenibacillus xylanexedens]
MWERDFTGGRNVVDVDMKSLGKKLGDNGGWGKYIVRVRGVGYGLGD